MNAFLETFRNLGVGRLAAAAGMAIGLIVFFVFLATRLSTSQLALLFDNLKQDDSTRIVQELESMGIPFELSSNEKQIRVPSDQVARLRLTFAEQGMPETGSIGYEIFDRDQTLGTSSFIQNINHVRAMEGELARTIATIASVKAARVHLVMPRREVFSRQRLDPSASIILKMRGSARLDQNQVQGVQHLVATAVAGLKPDRISIVDDRGALLSRGDTRDDESLAALNAEERRVSFETRMNRTLEQLLEPSVGMGNVRTEVRVEMDFDRIVTNEEIFDPDGQVARSTQTIEEANQNKEPNAGAVSVGQNLPDAQAGDNQGNAESASNRTEQSTNFEISKTMRKHVREGGQVKRMSVAVLINDRVTEGPDGKRSYEARGAAELGNIEKLVKTAVGFDAKRGDTIEIVNMRFADPPEMLGGLDDALILGFSTSDIRRLVEVLVLAVVGILIILLVVRPLIAKIFETAPAGYGPADGRPMLPESGAPAVAGALPGPNMAIPNLSTPGTAVAAAAGGGSDALLDVAQVDGRVQASSLKKIGDIIEKHPEEAVSIIRSWMYQDQT